MPFSWSNLIVGLARDAVSKAALRVWLHGVFGKEICAENRQRLRFEQNIDGESGAEIGEKCKRTRPKAMEKAEVRNQKMQENKTKIDGENGGEKSKKCKEQKIKPAHRESEEREYKMDKTACKPRAQRCDVASIACML